MSLLGGVNDLILAPFGGSPDTPKVTATEIDPETQALINRQVDRSKRTNADFAADDLTGVRATGDTFAPDSVENADRMERSRTAFGTDGDQSGLDKAIRRKQQAAYEGDINKINRTAALNAPQKKMNALNNAQNLVTAKNNYDQSLAQQTWQAAADAKAARAGALSSILGIAGTVVGGVFGGAGGAKAGNAAGTAGGGIMASAE